MRADRPGWLLVRQPPPPSTHCSLLQGLSAAAQSPRGAAGAAQLTGGPVVSLTEEPVSRRPQEGYF